MLRMLKLFSYAYRMVESRTLSGPAVFMSNAAAWTDPDGDGRVESCGGSDTVNSEEVTQGNAHQRNGARISRVSHVWNCYTVEQ